jgi:hypothetical protein
MSNNSAQLVSEADNISITMPDLPGVTRLEVSCGILVDPNQAQ